LFVREHRSREDMSVTHPVLTVEHLGVTFGNAEVLRDISFTLDHGELVGLVGPNGAGKSTLMRAICGLIPHHGSVQLGEVHCQHHRDRLGLGFIPQRDDIDPQFPISVRELVGAGRRHYRSLFARSSRDDAAAIDTAIDRVGLGDKRYEHIGTLSGGQLQRALLARALAQQSDVLLLDEALSGVDTPTTHELFHLFRELANDGRTLVVSTHDLGLARTHFDRCLAVNGKLVADGVPADVLSPAVLDSTFGAKPWDC
jgi:ABC-type Mn2+/Zn2+ transport system ATPase subunit